MFFVAVVVAGDAAGSDIRVLSNFRHADVAEVRRLRPGSESGVLRLDKILDFHFFPEVGFWAQVCEGTHFHAVFQDALYDLRRDEMNFISEFTL